MYDNTAHALIPHSTDYLPAIWLFCEQGELRTELRKTHKSLKITNNTLLQVPFDLEYWQKLAAKKYPNGLPKPYSEDPTQWIFHGHPSKTTATLQVAVARLLGYIWPAEQDFNMTLSDESRDISEHCEGLLKFADDDGIVCIPSVRGEKSAVDRLTELLLASDVAPISVLLNDSQCKGKDLEYWLRDKFFEQHCKLFNQRPFIWHIWDGLKDGFSALVNYHKLTNKNLETLTYTYLGDWIRTQEHQVRDNVDGADVRLLAAQGLEKKLKAIIKGESPMDIFVRWKPLSEQPVGWNPDINDGVRVNIRPFLFCGDVSKKDSGILRVRPAINWNKDRGKDVRSAPWYDTFSGVRKNDQHLTLAEKSIHFSDG